MSSVWDTLNQTVGGRLFVGVPFAEPCFPQSIGANATQCLQVQATYLDERKQLLSEYLYIELITHFEIVPRTNAPGAYIQTQWETCQATGAQCLLDFLLPNATEPILPPNQCLMGSVPSYFVR